jgi:hypothetical protein
LIRLNKPLKNTVYPREYNFHANPGGSTHS